MGLLTQTRRRVALLLLCVLVVKHHHAKEPQKYLEANYRIVECVVLWQQVRNVPRPRLRLVNVKVVLAH